MAKLMRRKAPSNARLGREDAEALAHRSLEIFPREPSKRCGRSRYRARLDSFPPTPVAGLKRIVVRQGRPGPSAAAHGTFERLERGAWTRPWTIRSCGHSVTLPRTRNCSGSTARKQHGPRTPRSTRKSWVLLTGPGARRRESVWVVPGVVQQVPDLPPQKRPLGSRAEGTARAGSSPDRRYPATRSGDAIESSAGHEGGRTPPYAVVILDYSPGVRRPSLDGYPAPGITSGGSLESQAAQHSSDPGVSTNQGRCLNRPTGT